MKLMIFIMKFPKNENYFTTCRYKAVARSVLNALAKQLIKTFENTADVTHEERNDAINHVKNNYL